MKEWCLNDHLFPFTKNMPILRSAGVAVGAQMGGSTMRRSLRVVGRASVTVAPSASQRRTLYYYDPAKREQEAFMSTFNPLSVMGLDEEATAKDIEKAYTALQAQHGPKATKPDTKKMERIDRAYEILKDTTSPFYTKAHASDQNRQRLQLEMLPKKQQRIVQIQLFVLCSIVAFGFLIFLKTAFMPMQKGLRAATR